MKSFVDRLQKILESKVFLIIAAIVLAIVAWIIVMDSSNPSTDMTFEVPIVFKNNNAPVEKGLTILDDLNTFRTKIKVSCRQKLMDKVSASDFNIVVDLGKIEQNGTIEFEIEKPVCEKLGVKVVDYSPKKIEITCDKKVEISLPVVVTNADAVMKKNYKYINIVTVPETIPMTGFSSELENLECVELDLSKQIAEGSVDRNKTIELIGHFITKAGTDVTANYDTKNIKLEINVAKRVPIVYSVFGNPAADCYLDNTALSESEIWVKLTSDGTIDELQALSEINLGSISLQGLDKNKDQKFNVSDILGPHFEIVQGSEEVTVSVVIAKLVTQKYTIQTSAITKKGYNNALFDYDVTYSSSTTSGDGIVVTLKGKPSDLENVTVANLHPTLEFSAVVGEYPNTPITFTIPENVKLVGDYFANIVVKDKVPEKEPEP